MPELPEVETTRRGLAPLIIGKKIKKVLVREPRLRWPVDPIISDRMQYQSIVDVRCKEKIWITINCSFCAKNGPAINAHNLR